MPAPLQHPDLAPPSDDKRWRIVQATMRRNGYRRGALIETLHSVQESFGYLDEESLRYVAKSLRAPLSQVYGVSTFYHFFRLKPAGKHACVICLGTACYIKGAPKLLEAIAQDFHIGAEETSTDGTFSVLTARCLGSCGLAPAAVFDGEVAGKLDPAQMLARLHRWQDEEACSDEDGQGGSADSLALNGKGSSNHA